MEKTGNREAGQEWDEEALEQETETKLCSL
jgi:hypothetical protein